LLFENFKYFLFLQDGNTPFTPDMIISHFLHAYIVVQPVDSFGQNNVTRYKISICAKSDVPQFGPSFPGGSNIVRKGAELKEFLLTKLMNAETSCYRAEKFSKLEHRTRISLLANLDQMLAEKTREFLGGGESSLGPPKFESERRQSSSKIIESVKRALSSKNKNSSSSNSDTSSNHHAKVVKSKSTMIPFGGSQKEVLSIPQSGKLNLFLSRQLMC
jgi:RAP1 GTPase activating protein 1